MKTTDYSWMFDCKNNPKRFYIRVSSKGMINPVHGKYRIRDMEKGELSYVVHIKVRGVVGELNVPFKNRHVCTVEDRTQPFCVGQIYDTMKELGLLGGITP